MKRLSILLTLALCAGPAFAEGSGDPYEDMAAKLSSQALKKLTEKKIAVLTFEYMDGRSSTGGRIVAEKLTNRFVELGQFTVIERGMVEKVMKELEFQNAGNVDPEKAKKLGKGLGVEAIITGTLQEMSYGNVEVNARVIKTESYEIVAAATQKVKKSWNDEAAPAAASAPSAVETPAPAPFRSAGPHGPTHGFLDLMLGGSNCTMNVTFSNPYFSGSANNLATGGSGVFGMRVGGFGEIVGGDFEFSVFNHGLLRQNAPANLNGWIFSGIPIPADFIHVNTFEMSGDLMLRLPTGEKVIPYFGLGLGLSINNVQSNSTGVWLTMYGGARENQTEPGFLFRVPFGVRFHVADPLDLFVEGRFFMNTFSFNQNIAGFNNTVTEQGFQFLGGVGLTF